MDPRSEHRNALDLMNQGKYDEARTILTKLAAVKTGDYVPPPKSITFALAYCDYKVGAFAKVKAALKDISAGDAACLNLLAQAHYNLEEFQDATAIYEGMLRDGLYRDDVERTELVTNLTAAYSQSNHSRCHAAAAEEGMTTFDIAFNAATGMIHAKEYAKARELLANALALCLHEHGLDASSCDVLELARQAAQPDCPKNVSKVVSDAAPVLVQRAFVHFSLNEIDSASEILKLLLALRDKISVATYAAACVNWAAIKRDSDYFDTLTRLKEVQRPAVEAKLTSRQKLFIRYNASLLLLSTAVGAKPQRGADQCKRVVDQMCKEFPTADLTSMALTAWLVRHGVSTKTETHFRSFVSQRGTVDITSRLTLAQFAVMRGDIRAAVDRLKTDKPLLTATPAALATAAHAYATTLNDRDAAVELLTEVRDAFDSGDAARRFDFYSFCAEFYLAHHRYAEATAALETLLSIAPKDDPRRPSWIRSVVIASARSDPTKTLKWASQLPNSAAASSGVAQPMPRQGIEEAGFRRPVAVAASAQQRPARSRPLRRKPAAPEGKPLPPIDPERWVPMKARTYVRDLPPRRQKELRRRRAAEQEEKRRQAERRKREQQQQQPQSPPAAPAAVAA